MVTKENIEICADKKRREVTRMEKMLANKKKKEAQERRQLEKRIVSERLKIQGLMSQLSDLKSELAQQKEASKALEMQIQNKEAPEIKEEEADTSEELQATKRRRKRTPQAGISTEKMQASKKQSKSTRSKPTDSKTDSQTSVKDDHADKITSETQQVKTKQLTKSVKEARGPQKKEARGPQGKEGKEARGPQGKEARGPEKKEARGPQGKEARGPQGKETRGPQGKEARGPQGKEARGPEKKEARGPEKKEARGPEKNIEKQESNSQESEGAVGGIRKPPGPPWTAAPRLKSGDSPSTSQLAAPSQGRKQAAVAAGEAHITVLRRSKRIASRT
ncbi:neurofilament heavy polypeptide-like [Etheostoma cragini]|uniref:neurofilament heavy polypeptide-like n=1 Tax=Etheostoma cragini TaxID=417921 RepID=UPI00155EF958|nr:neurofilament heavy polypeptide-like [Etheostoma cragini]